MEVKSNQRIKGLLYVCNYKEKSMTQATGTKRQIGTEELRMLKNAFPRFSEIYELLETRIVDADDSSDAEISVKEAEVVLQFIVELQRQMFINQEALKFQTAQKAALLAREKK